MKVAFFITRNPTHELLGCITSMVATHRHETVAIHFAEDGVYHLVNGTEMASRIQKFIEAGIKITACECSVKNRNIENLLINGVKIGHIGDFLDACEGAQIISL